MSVEAIDVEHHFIPPALVEGYKQAPPNTPGAMMVAVAGGADRFAVDGNRPVGRQYELEPRLEEMVSSGVAQAMLSIAMLPYYPADTAKERWLADLIARCNDESLAAAAGHPDRFGVLAAPPFPFADACLAELARLEGERLVRGVVGHAASNEWSLDRADLQPVYERLAERGLPLLIHPSGEGVHRAPMFDRFNLSAGIAAMVETTTVATRLMLSGMLDRVPGFVPVVPHLGGALPYLCGRIDDIAGTGDAEHDVRHYLRHRLRVGTCSFHHPALDAAAATVGPEHILLGTDYPYRGTLQRAVDDIRASSLSPDEQAGVLRENAVRLGLVLD
jgi:aminocarboxymuconate-semialdehyde decarboxylase